MHPQGVVELVMATYWEGGGDIGLNEMAVWQEMLLDAGVEEVTTTNDDY